MIIEIIVIALAITLIILAHVFREREISGGLIVLSIAFGISAIACPIQNIVANTESLATQQLRVELSNKVESLNATKELLESETYTYSRVEATNYHNEVSAFKTEIINKQRLKTNPWTSWFVNKVYLEYSPDCVSYIK